MTSVETFIARWNGKARAERANYQMFLSELCDALGVPRPDPAEGGQGGYRFERRVDLHHRDGTTSRGRIDLYRRGCFVLEAKQGANGLVQEAFQGFSEVDRRASVRRSSGWVRGMLGAKGQAEAYSRDLPAAEGSPPFLIVCDIGFCFDLYADFTRTGRHYAQFPDRESFRIYLPDLTDPAVRETLRRVWEEPNALDPARRRKVVTRDIARFLARLARALEKRHAPDAVATFLMRCVFSMFAQSVGLLPAGAFSALLDRCRDNPRALLPNLGEFWRTMDTGGFSTSANAELRRFNGGLFAPDPHGAAEGLPLEPDELGLLITASRRDWADVEPAIFGTLLENALEKRLRDSLGAHFTPRAFVERLVLPTVMGPLRAEWDGAKAAALKLSNDGDRGGAAREVRNFHARLCGVRVLDPACGTGNFLYVTLELMKRLEGEVLDLLTNLEPGEGDRLDLVQSSVDPQQFFGLEKNVRAVPVAELVLWIGWLQWHFRTRGGREIAEPILRDFRNIEGRDALLDFAAEEPERDARGDPVTRWGGRTKPHPVTGEAVPDETDRVPVLRLVGVKAAKWPDADFIVGNPPFVAGKDLREELGSGGAEALWAAYPKVPRSADLAMFFWWKAAQALLPRPRRRPARGFGLITSNSIAQTFCRRVVAEALDGKPPLRLHFAIPDHPWADGAGMAAVRIAMTAMDRGAGPGTLARVVGETPGKEGVPDVVLALTEGRINPDLTIGADLQEVKPLRANEGLSSPGVKLHGAGFLVTPTLARALGLGRVPGLEAHIRPYLNGRDFTQRPRGLLLLDLFGLSEMDMRQRFPDVYQHVLLRVKPEREQNNRATYRDNWWVFGEPRRDLRPALAGLPRYIATVETAKHRVFAFLPAAVLPDNKLIAIALDDAFALGVLSSRIHVEWALAAGGLLEDRPVYVKTECFDPFPFPDPTPAARAAIAALAEELDAHRKARLGAHPHLTLTGLYNTLAALRQDRPLTDAERDLHDSGQVSLLRDLHDRLDAAVAGAYGLDAALPAPAILDRLVALNRERAREEAAGQVRWLRPAFQSPATSPAAHQRSLEVGGEAAVAAADAPEWPRDLAGQFVALRGILAAGPADPAALRRRLRRPPQTATLRDLLAAMAAMGQARDLGDGRWAG